MPHELTTRSIQLRAQTIDETERSVEAVVATDAPVEVWDWRRGEVIDEILLAEGAKLPNDLRMLDTHNRWSLDAVIGSARNLRREEGSIVARLFFVRGDEEVDKIWNKVRQGHITDVSVGYRVDEAVTIEPGQTATVLGRKFTAGKRLLRIGTDWTPREVSPSPIGADQGAKLRQEGNLHTTRGQQMNEALRTYLEGIGLKPDATDAEAQRYYDELTGDRRQRADDIKAGKLAPLTEGQNRNTPAGTPGNQSPNPPAEPARNQTVPPAAEQTEDPEAIARRVLADERNRVRELEQLAGDDVPEQIRRQAIDEGWDLDRASRAFLGAVREGRRPASGPAIHSRDSGTGLSARTLAAGLLLAQGIDPTEHSMHNGQRQPRNPDRLTEQDADQGDRFSQMSAVDICRQAAYIDTGRFHHNQDDAIRAAVSGGTLTLIFTTSAYANLLAGWTTIGDTTENWCDVEDVANFLQHDEITVTPQARLQQLARGDTAKEAAPSDSREYYSIARYAKKWSCDEQDIIDDRLGAILGTVPTEMGEAARRVRPDLVYSVMIENAALIADSTAVFDLSTHANLGTAILGSDSLKTAISGMGKQRLNNNVLNITPRYLITPAALEWTADGLCTVNSLAKLFADTSDPVYTTENLIARRRLVPVMDDRLGATGVMDPRTEAVRTGSDTAWYLTSGARRGIRVAYRRGTGRRPVMRSFQLTEGQWGVGFDINLDLGVKFLDYRGWYKSTGAG